MSTPAETPAWPEIQHHFSPILARGALMQVHDIRFDFYAPSFDPSHLSSARDELP
jgi:hypothetical protein